MKAALRLIKKERQVIRKFFVCNDDSDLDPKFEPVFSNGTEHSDFKKKSHAKAETREIFQIYFYLFKFVKKNYILLILINTVKLFK